MSLPWRDVTKEWPPEPGPYLLVTNRLDGRDAFGHMSNVWLVRVLYRLGDEVFAYDDYDEIIHNISHWRYAIAEETP